MSPAKKKTKASKKKIFKKTSVKNKKSQSKKAKKTTPKKKSSVGKKKVATKNTKKASSTKKKTVAKKTKKTAPSKKKSATKKTRKPAIKKKISKTTNPKLPLGSKKILSAYSNMLKARILNKKIIQLKEESRTNTDINISGLEAVQIASALIFKAGEDWFYPYKQDMALMISLGMTEEELLLNVLSKEDDPNSHGRNSPTNYCDYRKNIMSQSCIDAKFTQAIGCAKAIKIDKTSNAVYISAKEESCLQGDFYEAINTASIEKLPVVFIIQKTSNQDEENISGGSIAKIANAFENVETKTIDGTDLFESFNIIKKAYSRAKSGKGPSVIEVNATNLDMNISKENEKEYRANFKKCPIKKLNTFITKNKVAAKKDLAKIEEDIIAQVDIALDRAIAMPNPSEQEVCDFTYYPFDASLDIIEVLPSGDDIYMNEAIDLAIDEEKEIDEKVCALKQNIQTTENNIVGNAIGMSCYGLNPVVKIKSADYLWKAMSQVKNEMAMINYRTKGDFSCPFTLRVPVGGYVGGSLYNSQSIESVLSHCPGLLVVFPSNATDAKALLKSSIRSNNPVLFLEHKSLYKESFAMGPKGDSDYLIPIGKSRLLQSGTDLSIITWGATVYQSLQAAEQLSEEGYKIEVIDLRTMVPFDKEAVFESVKKTNRVLIAHEDIEFMGFGAELAAQISTECFDYLDAPIKRIGMKYCAGIPYEQNLENEVLPQSEDILEAALELLEF